MSWWRANYRHNVEGDYDDDAKMRRGFSITKYFENEVWDWIHTISYGCTKFVDPKEDVNRRQLDSLILQVCLCYKRYDGQKWTSPLLTALANNEELPTTTEGTTFPIADPLLLYSYNVIDNLGYFGMPNYTAMEEIWKM